MLKVPNRLGYLGSTSSGYDERAWASCLPAKRPGRTHLRDRRFSCLAWKTLRAVEFEVFHCCAAVGTVERDKSTELLPTR